MTNPRGRGWGRPLPFEAEHKNNLLKIKKISLFNVRLVGVAEIPDG